MPTYTYLCDKCNNKFELFASYSNYEATPKCAFCKSKGARRSYSDDLANAVCSVKKHSSELKTVGDLANRNRDRMSDDQKLELHAKHNSYKEQAQENALPKGMNRIKKPKKKTKWI